MEIDDQGGVIQTNRQAERRSRDADLLTLPTNIPGTNCANCKFITDVQNAGPVHVGYCVHPKLQMYVTNRQCCSYWDAIGALRT